MGNEPIVAVVTPFQGERAERVDHEALRDHLSDLSRCGVRRIVANGTTAEFCSLTLTERKEVLETSRLGFPGEIIAHVSATAMGDVRELMAHGSDHADAFLLLPPYYFADIPQTGLLAFLSALASEAPRPLYLYNFPRHTQVPLTPELVVAVRERSPGLRGIKDSGGALAGAVAYKERLGEAFEVYLGADALALQALESGLDGSVTGGAQPVAELLVGLAAAFAGGDRQAAQDRQDKLNGWTQARKLAGAGEPSVIKAALGARLPGYPPQVRPPLAPLAPAAFAAIRQAVHDALG